MAHCLQYVFLFSVSWACWQFGSAEPQAKAQPPQPRPHSWSAIGDGVADDTAAIQAAVDASLGDVAFPAGTYRITAPILIDLSRVGRTSLRGGGVARIVMEGAGPAIRFRGTHAGTAAPSSFQPGVLDAQNSPMVDGLEIVGRHDEACGIEASGTMQLTLTRLVVRDCLHAVHLVQRNRNVTLGECHLYQNAGIGVFLDHVNLHQINIANCHISYNAGGGVVSRGSELRNLQIGTCDIEGNMGGAESPPTANVLLDAEGTSIGEVAIVGCTIQHTHDAPQSANIRIHGYSSETAFTDERRHGNITIADNILSDVQCNIEITEARGVTISGNTIWKGYDHNLIVRGCQNVVLSGNLFDRNPRYHYGDGASAALGVLFEDCSDCTLSGNHSSGTVEHEAAWVLRRCKRMNMHGCTILDYGRSGLLLDDVRDSQITGCLIRDDRPGAKGEPIRRVGQSADAVAP